MILFHLHGAKRVFAFEPHPTLYKLAVKNAKLNKVRFSIANVGLSDKVETKNVMGRATRSFGHGVGPFLDPEKDKHHQVIKLVPAYARIKRIVNKIGRIQLLKVDCEGYEILVMPQISSLLNMVNHVVIECHGIRRKKTIIGFFQQIGMTIHSESNVQTDTSNKISTLHTSWRSSHAN
jgi:FkbM family methyltransferase